MHLSISGWQRVQCFGHRLNLAVKKAVKVVHDDINDSIVKMRRVITHFTHSSKKSTALKEAQVRFTNTNR